ncbi:NAD-dependent malic enzyme [Bacillus spizizenii ATCC 6633 = JCM 2499]|uniref:NAD(P)-binding domain-containing protein n=3 Tax=Bacillus spizizenii TaxID=96241 RepID=A0A9Q4DTD6_BACSC|nr:malic enzyme-like NAD(P)-binding protein [Bacillus spizizenii]KFI03343.1 NAD-dependent malic enzyme 1 [Bacillus sp. BSC154]MDU7577533.1 malic enzyme-like NAD(P)-binding protein [Bacillus subtilis]ADM38354.1 NAD-dependent malic enzyme (conversion of malate into pyruvate) [Bacillus spizizenii str. W23]AJW83933.1 NAD-dependent malic enzyme 1 [Bacillus spizizenii]EFG91491.1 NAD-dependent malic enzyme (conversion of malate into pyruvate) [Bacillus spizizenii ATCC 6633 = JCM 2499]
MIAKHMIRTLMIETPSVPGNLGRVATAIGLLGGDIGEVETVKVGPNYTMRNITVQVENEEQLQEVIAAVQALGEGIRLHTVSDEVLSAHEGGKIQMKSKMPIRSLAELGRVYTPGVADVCRLIEKEPEKASIYTTISNSVAIVTDGTAILGLGNIGSVAGMPVMEGKAALFDQLAGISGIPILLDTSDPEEIIKTVKHISPGFNGILLEDIGSPHCFEIEDRLKEELNIPVMHDDQHGTAVVTLAAAISACRSAGVDLKEAKVGQIGLGAAGVAICRMFMAYGVKAVYGTDKSEAAMNRLEQYGGQAVASIEELMETCDIIVATTGVPGLIKPAFVRSGQVILALSNPKPEIEPEAALQAGAAYAADGRSVNNVLGFPGIFRGALNAKSKEINHDMLVAAAEAIAACTKQGDVVPQPLDSKVHHEVAAAVEHAALTAVK